MGWDVRFSAFPAVAINQSITREFITLYKNGSAFVRSQDTDFNVGTGLSVQGNTRTALTAGDQFQVYQYTVSTGTIYCVGGSNFTEFSGQEIITW